MKKLKGIKSFEVFFFLGGVMFKVFDKGDDYKNEIGKLRSTVIKFCLVYLYIYYNDFRCYITLTSCSLIICSFAVCIHVLIIYNINSLRFLKSVKNLAFKSNYLMHLN